MKIVGDMIKKSGAQYTGKVYAILGDHGQYSDWTCWLVKVFYSKEEAQKLVDFHTKACQSVHKIKKEGRALGLGSFDDDGPMFHLSSYTEHPPERYTSLRVMNDKVTKFLRRVKRIREAKWGELDLGIGSDGITLEETDIS